MRGRSSRYVRSLPLVLLLGVLIAMSLVSCGGDEDETTTTRMTTAPSPTSGGSGGGGGGSVEVVIRPTDDTPQALVDALGAQPVVVLFYVDGSRDDMMVFDSLQKLQLGFANYAFLYYRYSEPDAYGDLASLLEVDYPPDVAMFDGAGVLRFRWNGYMDEGSLNQTLVNLGRY